MHSVSEDPCGYIWIGTTAGLNKIDPVTFEVLQYPIKSPFKGSSFIGYIYSVFADSHDFIWFGTDVALFKMDSNTGLYEAIPTQKDEHSIPDYSISYNGFLEDSNGLWISTGAGISYFDYKTQLFFHRYHNPEGKAIFNITKATSSVHSDLRQDSKGKLWFVLEHDYLASYDILSDKIDTFKMENPPGTWKCCHSIGIDVLDNIWVGSRHGGVQIFNTTQHSFTSLRAGGINSLIQSDYIYSIERGRDEQMFVAHDNGLDIIDMYDVSLQEIKLSGRNDFLNLKFESGDISFDEHEAFVYIPFYKFGFFRYDLNTGMIALFEDASHMAAATPFIYQRHGQAYMASGHNLEGFTMRKDGIVRLNTKLLPDTISNTKGEVIWCFDESPQSTYVKKSSGRIFHLNADSVDVLNGFGFKANICVSPDSQYLTYITPELNLIRRNFKEHYDDTFFLQRDLTSIDFSFANPRHIVDDGHSVWMTGQNGLLRMHYPNGQLNTYGFDKGLSHSFTFSLTLDGNQNVWVGNLGGIDRYDSISDRFISVYKVKGNTYMDAFGSALCSKAGDLFFHFGNKLIRIRPDQKDLISANEMNIQLHEVLVNGKNVDWHDPGKLSHLHYDQNRLTFVYDMLIFDNSEIVSFYYRLDGKEWISNGQRNEVNLDGLASSRHTLEFYGTVGSQFNKTKTLSIPFRIRPPWWNEWWFFVLVMLLFVIMLWKWFRSRIISIQQELLVARQIADLESKALKAQMNPHFVFNSLNAIQECIVTGKVEEAYAYLSQFARLLRLVLEHSDMAEVSLHDELEVLSLFVSLEKLRFRNDMQYALKVEKDLDDEEIRIPPMLIQPHLENAIWHGLRHRDGEKKLTLTIAETIPGYLEVVIEDNGVGRVKAAALHQDRLGGHKHKSIGKQLSGNRLELLRKNHPRANMEIVDLYDGQGMAIGTKVILVIPITDIKTETRNKE
jgi:ligand-binding sensor domain-containing protein